MNNEQKFNNILDECLERMLKGDSLEDCLKSYPEHAAELEPLLKTAQLTRQISSIQPRPEFKQKAKYQFQAAVREKFCEAEAKKFRWSFGWHFTWATALAVFVVVVMLAGGTVAAAGNSMPDQPLYPVKLATEKVRVLATPSALAKAELHAELADNRVNEIIYLAEKNDAAKLESTEKRLIAHLTNVATLAAKKKANGGATTAQKAADTSAERKVQPFSQAAPRAPSAAASPAPKPASPPTTAPAARPAPAPAPAPASPTSPATGSAKARFFDPQSGMYFNSEAELKAYQAAHPPAPAATPKPTAVPRPSPAPVPSPTPRPAPTTAAPDKSSAPAKPAAPSTLTAREKTPTTISAEREKLKQAIVRNAINHPAKLNEALKKAPASIKPALRKAIEESLAGYEQALKNIEADDIP